QADADPTDSAAATVTITVNSQNDAPLALDDTYTVNEDTTLSVSAPGVLANDSDVEADPLSAVLVSSPAHGALTLNSDGSFSYTPAADYNGSDSFTYKANDGNLDSAVATVSITVNQVNDAPLAVSDSYTVDEDTPLTVSAPAVLGNDSDADGDPLNAVLVSGPSHGVLTLNTNGSFNYVPAANYNGSDSFTYQANDGATNSAIATVNITVNSVNDAPLALDDTYTVNEDATLTVSGPGVLGNDADADADTLNAVLVSAPSHGTLILNGDGSFTYVPNPNYNG